MAYPVACRVWAPMMICGVAMLMVYGSQPAEALPAPHPDEVGQVHAAAVGDAVLAVAGEDEIVVRGAPSPEPIWAASWPSSGGHSASSPWRWRAVASVSMRRMTTMSSYREHELLIADVPDPGVILRMADALTAGSDQLDKLSPAPL